MIIALQTLVYFRESVFTVLNRWLQPYYKRLALVKGNVSDDSDEEEDVHVYSDYDEEKGVVFFPPMYAQRYAAVSDCLLDERWCGKIEKVVDLGYNDISFIKYLKEVPGVRQILGVDLESIPLRCSSGLFGGEDYTPKRENPLRITLFQGNAADPDYRLIGCDAVVAIEIIEHMLPHDLERLIHTVFGFIQPWVAVFTTPNADFNVLFKSLEKNGLRRLDHLFEWTREQFNDWCSNIVVRYPDYTVSCRGIGPGPPDTVHYGCCSQMAVFTSKNYQKQQDLDPQSMAVVANAPITNSLVLAGNWECESTLSENHMLCDNTYPIGGDCNFELESEQASTIFLSSSSNYQMEPLECRDSIAQCNLDKEFASSFLMFDRDIETYQKETYHVLVPRRKIQNKVYFFEDVASRLNCSTYQVKKFSKTTQNLMQMNKIDSLAHTREVVDEIKQLTHMLNFQRPAIQSREHQEAGIWCNINWGDNAPYWNQYYTVVRDYNYPFETKSEECRILDLISDEINRIVDNQYDNDYGLDINKLEIPISSLMQVVQHITDDQDKVKELLEWNGYEVEGDVVVHSRMAIDNLSLSSHGDAWQENDTLSDWDTEMKTTSISDETASVHDLPGRTLRRALDRKVRKLRSMMTADEDITSELDKVVCRLMKLTLRTSRGRQMPPPTKWMQCKLLDLLTLTEKAVERRRRHIIEKSPMRAITYATDAETTLMILNRIKEDNTGLDLVKKYSHIVKHKPDLTEGEYFPLEVDDLTVCSEDKDFEIVDHSKMVAPTKTSFERTQEWVEKELELVNCPVQSERRCVLDSVDNSVSYNEYNQYDLPNIKGMRLDKKNINRRKYAIDDNPKSTKKVLCKKTSSYLRCNIKKVPRKREIKEYKMLQSTIAKPIPGSIIELCTPDITANKNTEKPNLCSNALRTQKKVIVAQITDNTINNEESYIGDIVMDGDAETSLLHGVSHHTTGTDVETDKKHSEKDTVLGSVINAYNECNEEFDNSPKSETIFLHDINEPSTSKGVRHLSMDAQCGPDKGEPECLAPSSSPMEVKSTEDNLKHSLTNMFIDSKKSDFGTTMNSETHISPTLHRTKSVGIKIKDSNTEIHFKETEKSNSPFAVQTESLRISNEEEVLKPQQFESLKEVKVLDSNDQSEKVEVVVNNPITSNLDIASIIMSRLKLCYARLHVYTIKENLVPKDDKNAYQRGRQKQRSKSESSNKLSSDESAKLRSSTSPLKKMTNNLNKKQSQVEKSVITPRAQPKNPSPKKSESTAMANMGPKLMKAMNPGSKKIIQIRNPKLTIIKKRSGILTNENEIKVANNSFRSRGISSTSNLKVTSKKDKSSCESEDVPAALINNMSNSKHVSKIPVIQSLNKSYLPSYLKRRLNRADKLRSDLNESLDTVKTKIESKSHIPRLKRSKTEDFNSFSHLAPSHLSEFLVYRNETRKTSTEENSSERSVSPVSMASSTCSSPASVVTIKIQSNSKNNDSGSNVTATPIKKLKTLKIRSGKSSSRDDKENDPAILCSENTYVTSNPTIFMTKLSGSPLQTAENTLNKQRKAVIPCVESAVENRFSLEVVKDKSLEDVEKQKLETIEQGSLSMELSDSNNMNKDLNNLDYPRTSTPIREIESKELNNNLIFDLLELKDDPRTDSANVIFATELIDDVLGTIENITDNLKGFDSATINLGQEDFRDDTLDDEDTSIESGKTVVNTLQNIMECDEQDRDNSFDTVVGDVNANLTVTPAIEAVSFQTCTASNTLQDIEENCSDRHPLQSESGHESYYSATRGSVLDLYERKDILPCPENVGPLAIQAFSGFSVNNPPVIGDQQADYISLFDSETGSPAMGVSRQAESEEIFISGRSSVTYASCSIDEDTTVPEWLFRIINQPLQVQNEDLEAISIPLPEPHFDANGNIVDPLVGNDAGAGDGRGVHSDLSQDSSGQGSSLSSSDPSSGPQSEAVLIDPSILTGQFGIPPAIPLNFDSDASSPIDITEAGETIDQSARLSREVHLQEGPLLGASDADADESSLDTDAE